jgi:hypothetical protein
VDAAGRIWEGDSVQIATKEARLTQIVVENMCVYTLDEVRLACCKTSMNVLSERSGYLASLGWASALLSSTL